MKNFFKIFFLLIFSTFCFGVTIQLRKGGTVKGEIVSKGRKEIVIKTESGEKTIKWNQVKGRCIKEIYPELYERLKAEAIKRKKNKEEESSAGKDYLSDKPDFSKIGIKVTKTEKSGSFEKQNEDRGIKTYCKLNQGILEIKLDWLKKNKNYKLKTVFTHYLKADNMSDEPDYKPKPSDVKTEKIENISNKTNVEIKYLTSPYREYKKQIRAGISTGGGSKRKFYYGYHSGGWDISVWLDDKLVYKEKKDKKPECFIIREL